MTVFADTPGPGSLRGKRRGGSNRRDYRRIGVPGPANRGIKAERSAYPSWFLWPAFAILGVFFLLPTVLNFVYAFTNWSAYHDGVDFVGWQNFEALLGNGDVLIALRTTLIWAVLVAVLQNVFGFALALFFERDSRINRASRAIFFIPVLISPLAIGYIFQALLKPDGALNGMLGGVLGQSVSIAWLGDTTWTIVVVSIVQSWKWMGLSMLIYLAGLKSIPEDVLEAAKIDGASWWRTLRSVRFPLLAPAVTFNVATALLGSMNGFDTVQATTKGGPAGTTEVLNIFIYRTFGQGLYAQATTMSLILFLVVILLAFPIIWALRRREKQLL
ncbi:carbohydrate ABC transporter permease [Cryobacterium arcticum]|uniref:ABC transporter permease n=1 Tax=Cryobacterium arcticum TaxID=670052 RepID=A0A317ZWP4_9MICO|nr:sugar ABC transporter permease [Cryobacterium arcticum]PXA71719.1 ABC transporter permease [Cryobacterium arcticum]